jgi:hypothetical protein
MPGLMTGSRVRQDPSAIDWKKYPVNDECAAFIENKPYFAETRVISGAAKISEMDFTERSGFHR